MEIWKDIVGFENYYQISNYGNVKSLRNNIILKAGLHPNGYYGIVLKVNGTKIGKEIHRLVGEAFIPKIDGKTYIGHIDNNKTNNNVDNLTWCTQQENIQHCVKCGRLRPQNGWLKSKEVCSKKVYQLSKNGEIINEFNSTKEASRITGIDQGSVSRCCNNISKTAGGYIWRFIEWK